MYDRRRHKRLPITYELSIRELFSHEENVVMERDDHIVVTDVSRTGVGFESSSDLPMDYYFEAKIEFDEKVYIYCVLKIIRKQELEQGFLYGCEFVGMPEFIKTKIDEYETRLRG